MFRYLDKTVFLFLWHFFVFLIKSHNAEKRVLIKSPHPADKRRFSWGDFHLAKDLGEGIEHHSTIRCFVVPFEYWNMPFINRFAHCSIMLSGVYKTVPSPLNPHILYIISHPEILQPKYLKHFSQVVVASSRYKNQLTSGFVNASFIPQFSNPNRFTPQQNSRSEFKDKVVFIGNTRGQFRESVRVCIENEIPILVYGAGWDEFIDPKYINGTFINNDELSDCYSNAAIVLNDHWESMKQFGFLSNRVFDVAMCRGFVISDSVEGLPEELKACFVSYNSPEQLINNINYYLSNPAQRLALAQKSHDLALQHYTHLKIGESMKRVIESIKHSAQ